MNRADPAYRNEDLNRARGRHGATALRRAGLVAGLAVLGFWAGSEVAGFEAHRVEPARVLAVIPDKDDAYGRAVAGAVIEKAKDRLMTDSVLASAATSLHLADRPDFAGPHPEQRLRSLIRIDQEADAPVISISADLDDTGAGADIANYLSRVLTEEAAFKMGDGAKVSDLQTRIASLDAELGTTDTLRQEAERRAKAISTASSADVLSGRFPPDLATPQITSLQARYAAAKAAYDALAQKLGELHPQLQAARTDMDRIRQAVDQELASLAADLGKRARDLSSRAADEGKQLESLKAELAAIQKKSAELERNVTEANAAAPGNGEITGAIPVLPRFSLVSAAADAGPDVDTILAYGACGALFLGLAGGLSVSANRSRSRTRRRPTPAAPDQRRPEQLGILEQIEMLEAMWPSTGRRDALPYAVNDDPEQRHLRPARQAVAQLHVLRENARRAVNGEGDVSLEDVLSDMQALRAKVQWYAAEQERQQRLMRTRSR